MKKFMSMLLAVGLLFPIIGVPTADAIGSVSTPRVSTPAPRISTPTPKVSTPSTPKVSTSKSSVSTSKSSTSSKSTTSSKSSTSKSTTSKSTTKSSTPKTNTTSKYKSSYYKPSQKGIDYNKYSGKPYYNSSTGFSTMLLTSMGAYLILDGFEDDGDPIYIDADTGEEIDDDDLDSLGVQSVDEIDYDDESYSDNSSTSDTDGGVFLAMFLVFIVISLGAVFIVAIRH